MMKKGRRKESEEEKKCSPDLAGFELSAVGSGGGGGRTCPFLLSQQYFFP